MAEWLSVIGLPPRRVPAITIEEITYYSNHFTDYITKLMLIIAILYVWQKNAPNKSKSTFIWTVFYGNKKISVVLFEKKILCITLA